MDLVICGDGRLGWAIADAADARGDRARVLGRPGARRHDPSGFAGADVVIDASRGDALASNLAAAFDGGVSRVVIATTGWDEQRDLIERILLGRGVVAIVAPNLSVGAAVFERLVVAAAADLAAVQGFEPFLWEWHRRGKLDRPSGTARRIARRIAAVDPRAADLEVSSIRAGESPGVHVAGFDGPGETIELRLTARDRSAYAAGALTAADWLMGDPRPVGLHPFDHIVDALLHPSARVDAA